MAAAWPRGMTQRRGSRRPPCRRRSPPQRAPQRSGLRRRSPPPRLWPLLGYRCERQVKSTFLELVTTRPARPLHLARLAPEPNFEEGCSCRSCAVGSQSLPKEEGGLEGVIRRFPAVGGRSQKSATKTLWRRSLQSLRCSLGQVLRQVMEKRGGEGPKVEGCVGCQR